MKRVIAVTAALLLLGSSAAFARDYDGGWGEHGYRDHRVAEYSHRHDNDAGAAIGAGILGFFLGALASSAQNQNYYAPAYAAPVAPYGYGYAPAYGYTAPYGYAAPGASVGLHF